MSSPPQHDTQQHRLPAVAFVLGSAMMILASLGRFIFGMRPSRTLLLLLLPFVLASGAFAQTNPITSITISLPANPDANTANWGSPNSGVPQFAIKAVARTVGDGRLDPAIANSRILMIVRNAADKAKVCGLYTGATAPAAIFSLSVKEWSAKNVTPLLGRDCTLLPGDYQLSVQFFSSQGTALSEERTRDFSISPTRRRTR
jgi:hypothetical protein